MTLHCYYRSLQTSEENAVSEKHEKYCSICEYLNFNKLAQIHLNYQSKGENIL